MAKHPTERQIYKHLTSYYQALLDRGMTPEVAKELTVQQVAEGGYDTKWWSGDEVKFNTPGELADHVIGHHSRMYPDSLKATNFDEFYNGIQRTGKAMYNSEKGYNGYKRHLLSYRPAILRRLDKYEQSKTPAVQSTVQPTAQPTTPINIENIVEKNDATSVLKPMIVKPIQAKKLGGRLKRHLNLN